MIKNLKDKLKGSELENQILEKEIKERKDRFQKRESEYREIIADLNRQLK